MGVYVFQSKHMPAIKIGHYAKLNAWSRVAHRGFYSCICPDEIKDKVSVEDLELIYWFPYLTNKDEINFHNQLQEYRICGEWFSIEALNEIQNITNCENNAHRCSKEKAIESQYRL